jgi:GMP synthase (glutamine-hydrolysing)
MRFLIIDGYDRSARNELIEAGAHIAADLYNAMLFRYRPDAVSEIVFPADTDCALPDLSSFDAMLWTGSSLTAYHDTPAVKRQIELMQAGLAAGLRGFGSCWALQIACVAAGGSVRLNPNGREFGLARKIQLTSEGAAHWVFANRSVCFDGFSSHFDEVDRLPTDSILLAQNGHTQVQAAEIRYQGGSFIGLQYHPEYDLAEIAALARFRAAGLIQEGRFQDDEDLEIFSNDFITLNNNDQLDLRWKYGVDDDVIVPARKQNEFINWLDRL